MAIYHLSVKAVSRSAGRSATAAAAYRAGCEIADERTGEIHDYTRKGGVESADIVLPDGAPEWATDRAKLWNAAELAEKRKDACVAREFEVALPSELSTAERRRLALDFAKDMANREGCAVDVAIHAPGKEGDNRNHHAHILRTTRKVKADGLGAKLDTEQAGRKRKDDLEQVRARWAQMTNDALARTGRRERVDHRTLGAQGIDREPTIHLGPAATAIERQGRTSQKTLNQAERQGSLPSKTPARLPEPSKQSEAPTPSTTPEKTLAERLVASLEAMLDWIKGAGGRLVELQDGQAYFGPVVQLNDLHAVQSTGRGKYAVHELAKLDQVLALDDSKTEVHYRGGVGQVKGQGLGRGGRAG